MNRVNRVDNYPIPKTEDLLAMIGEGEKFSKLDMSQAYQQLLLEEDSKKYLVINAHAFLRIIGCHTEFRQLPEYFRE